MQRRAIPRLLEGSRVRRMALLVRLRQRLHGRLGRAHPRLRPPLHAEGCASYGSLYIERDRLEPVCVPDPGHADDEVRRRDARMVRRPRQQAAAPGGVPLRRQQGALPGVDRERRSHRPASKAGQGDIPRRRHRLAGAFARRDARARRSPGREGAGVREGGERPLAQLPSRREGRGGGEEPVPRHRAAFRGLLPFKGPAPREGWEEYYRV